MVLIYGKSNIDTLYINDRPTPVPPNYRVERVMQGIRLVYVKDGSLDIFGVYEETTPDEDVMNAILDHMRNNNYGI